MPTRRDFIKMTGAALGSMLLEGCDPAPSKRLAGPARSAKPNFVIILADDMGFSDLACYGGEIHTPNLNRLADNGIRFTRFYNAARCCPSRASLLTGVYPHQAGLGHMNTDAGYQSYQGSLSENVITFAEALKRGHYQTFMTGKWHVARTGLSKEDIGNWPCQRGFDEFFGTSVGYCSLWDPIGLIENNDFIEPDDSFFYTDAITDRAVRYIQQAKAGENPFLLYVAYPNPHYPLHARPDTIEKYQGAYGVGWEAIRRQRLERMQQLGIVRENFAMQELDPASIPWEDEEHQPWQGQRMQAYAAMVDEMDQGIGKIVQSLQDNALLENTLIIFLSDNGGSCEGHLYNTVERSGDPWKSPLIPAYTSEQEKVIPGDIPGIAPGPAHTFGAYGLKWASVSNTPFRRHKSWVHEGGIATPCIMHWPQGIEKAPRLNRDNCHIMDIMATLLDLAGVEYPDEVRGKRLLPLEGLSLARVFRGQSLRRGPLFWEHEGNRAVMLDDWKLVSEFPGLWKTFYPQQSGEWELYNLRQDRGECSDLSARYPQKTLQMQSLYEAWAKRVGVVDWAKLLRER